MTRRALPLLLCIALVAAACSDGGDDDSASSTSTSGGGSPTSSATSEPRVPDDTSPVTALPMTPAAFSTFDEIPLVIDAPAYTGPATPTSLQGVSRPPGVEITPAEEEALTTNGFVVVPADYRQFQQAYDASSYAEGTAFVTTDAAYHAMHLAFSKVLREVEQQRLLPLLETLVSGGLDAALAQRDELAGTDLADSADRVVQLYQAAGALLGLDVGALGPLAEREVALAEEAALLTESPITSFGDCDPLRAISNCVDYSMFKPRGHYTRNPDLERYFRAMSLLGNSAFFLGSPQSLRIGLLATRVLVADAELMETWRHVYEPTAFMVGTADDYTPLELAEAADDALAGWIDDPAGISDNAVVNTVADSLRDRRRVAIDEEAASARLMGARFVIDSFVYDRLRWPFVGEDDNRRVVASPLDLASAMGSQTAHDLQEAAGESDFLHYDEQLDALRARFAERDPEEWGGTVYDAWLHALEPVWVSKGSAYPDFMRGDAWTVKDLQTGAASYAELKHDTILYAKQSFAAEGGFEPLGYTPRHWVEPDPVAFERMSAVLGMLRGGLVTRGLVSPSGAKDWLLGATTALLDSTIATIDRLGRLARDELARRPISAEDNDWLSGIGPVLEAQWIQSSDIDPEIGTPADDDTDAAVVADIMRSTAEYVEIGTGRIDRIMVLVPDDTGGFQVAFGGVYSYYEFSRPEAEGRLTDAEWRALLDSGDAPPRPAWQDEFLAG